MNYRALYFGLLASALFLLAGACHRRSSLSFRNQQALSKSEQHGQKIFMEHCQRCHPQGEAGLGPAILWTPDLLKRFQVRHGAGAMPAFDEEHLSDKELDLVIEYLRVAGRKT